jgi:hypothetical protein
MTRCPNCQAEINEDFGLVTCASCGAQVLIEMDGVAGQGVASAGAAENEPPLPPIPSAGLLDELSQVLVDDVSSASELPPIPVQEAPRTRASEEASVDMRKLADFGNSDSSQGREGYLRFDLFISGIDTVDVRNEIREILSDARFLWDADQLIQSMRNGEIRLKELTAVKSAILVSRLRSLAVEIRWEQYAINQG